MPNHVHLIAVPEREESLSDAIRSVHGKYAELFNGLYDVVGHLWQGRFGSSVMDEHYLLNAVRYVERNPVRARLVNRAEDYPWSSAAAHCGLRLDPLLSEGLPLVGSIENWSCWLEGVESEEDLKRLRDCTQRCRPCGSEEFVSIIEGP
jgi:putative transposase